jgi:hypothetical protein
MLREFKRLHKGLKIFTRNQSKQCRDGHSLNYCFCYLFSRLLHILNYILEYLRHAGGFSVDCLLAGQPAGQQTVN